jgi:hypothetical protein
MCLPSIFASLINGPGSPAAGRASTSEYPLPDALAGPENGPERQRRT